MLMAFGKPNPQVLGRTVFHDLGLGRRSIISGPQPGVDVGVVRINRNRVLIGSSDPLSYIQELGPLKSGFLSVHGIASDIATSGFAPQYAFLMLNLPPSMSDSRLTGYWKAIHRYCLELGISILGGHTGRFQGIDYTVVGAGSMFAVAPVGRHVTAAMARSGDDLILTKSAGLEAAVVLANVFPKTAAKGVGSETAARTAALWEQMTTVKDALIAGSTGLRTSVTAMHDVAEGGVFSAALDIAAVSGLKVRVETESVPVFGEVREVCKIFHIDPHISLGQGGLLICARPRSTDSVLRSLKRKRIVSKIIGTLSYRGRNIVVGRNGRANKLARKKVDPYWPAYWNAIRKGLK